MESGPEQHVTGPRIVGRRQLIAGTGVAAAVWIAPTIIHMDVAAAAGTCGSVVTVLPLSIPACVSVNPNVVDTLIGEAVFGEFGRSNDPSNNGDTFTVTCSSPPPHTQVSVTVRICYQDTWEQSGSGADTMDIQVDGVSGPGYPSSNVGDDSCIDYTFTVAHTGGLVLDIIGNPVALAEDFGIASVVLEFT